MISHDHGTVPARETLMRLKARMSNAFYTVNCCDVGQAAHVTLLGGSSVLTDFNALFLEVC